MTQIANAYTAGELLNYIAQALPRFQPQGQPEPLSGGNLNHVWRLAGQPKPLVIKQAPPYVAKQPNIPLDPSRLLMEAAALQTLAQGGALASVASDRARPPHPQHLDTRAHILIMEDLGDLPDLARALRHPECETDCQPEHLGHDLGRFIGQLHSQSLNDPQLARRFDNRAMQQTRNQVQYQQVGALCSSAGLTGADRMAARAVSLGRTFLQPGQCLTQGDLWPASILVDQGRLRLIDWELCHFGQAAQDLGHFGAHCWMQAHRAANPEQAQHWQGVWEAFVTTYRAEATLEGDSLLSEDNRRLSQWHAGAEIIMRCLGPFQAGYLYEGLEYRQASVQEALAQAQAFLLEEDHPWFAQLRSPVAAQNPASNQRGRA